MPLATGGVAPPAYPVSLRRVAETKVATIRSDVDQSTLVTTMIDARARIEEHLRSAGADLTGEVWWIFHGLVTPDSEAPRRACRSPARWTPAGPITIRVEPAHTEAYSTVTRDECSYPRIMAVYDAVESWVRAAGRHPAGPTREVYFARWDEASGGDPFAHVAEPIEEEPR